MGQAAQCLNCGAITVARFHKCPGCGGALTLVEVAGTSASMDSVMPVQQKSRKKWPIIVGALVLLCVLAAATVLVINFIGASVPAVDRLVGQVTTRVPLLANAPPTETPVPPTDTPVPRPDTPTPTDTPESTATPTPEPKTMYVCGFDRCRDSGEYGTLIFASGIKVWNAPGPDRGGVMRQVSHQNRVAIVQELRVSEGPGGLWYELTDGGWIDDLWLTDISCSEANLEGLSFTNCEGGEY